MQVALMSESCSSKPVASGCGCGAEVKFDGATPAYRRALTWVIAINLLGFAVVLIGGLAQGSASLSANALDFLADSATYAISLWAIGRSVAVRTGAALFKGLSLGAVALSVAGFAAWRAWTGAAPSGEAISILGLFGALANLVAAALLVRFRDGDANVRSVWLCTRNDLIQCLAVAATGLLVWWTRSRWPDLIVGVLLAAIFLQSAVSIIRQARTEHRAALLNA
jgi:Co/Zn/Cd efflux system component